MLIFEVICLCIRFFITSSIGFFYAKSFSRLRYGKYLSFAVWTVAYMAALVIFYLLFNRILPLDNILSLLLDAVALILLQKLLFVGDNSKELFVCFSFLAAKEMIIAVIVVLNYHVVAEGTLRILEWLSEDTERFLKYGETYIAVSDTVITVLTVAAYVLALGFYLKALNKGFENKDYPLQMKESLFLYLPPVSSLAITITVKMMEVNEEGAFTLDIFDRVPSTIIWIPLINIMLLALNVASVVLFQKLVQLSDEKSKRNLLEIQLKQTEKEIGEIQDIYSDIRGLRHDMRDHITNISLYVRNVLGDEHSVLNDYIGKMLQTVDRLDFSFNTGNSLTDIVIHQKAQEAAKKGISFKSDFMFPCDGNIDVYDMVVILNNGLENGIEACEKAEGERGLLLRSCSKGGLFFIEMENDFSGDISLDAESGLPSTSKEDKAAHGLGLANIQRCAKKYMGDIDITVNKNRFTLTVMLKKQYLTPENRYLAPKD